MQSLRRSLLLVIVAHYYLPAHTTPPEQQLPIAHEGPLALPAPFENALKITQQEENRKLLEGYVRAFQPQDYVDALTSQLRANYKKYHDDFDLSHEEKLDLEDNQRLLTQELFNYGKNGSAKAYKELASFYSAFGKKDRCGFPYNLQRAAELEHQAALLEHGTTETAQLPMIVYRPRQALIIRNPTDGSTVDCSTPPAAKTPSPRAASEKSDSAESSSVATVITTPQGTLLPSPESPKPSFAAITASTRKAPAPINVLPKEKQPATPTCTPKAAVISERPTTPTQKETAAQLKKAAALKARQEKQEAARKAAERQKEIERFQRNNKRLLAQALAKDPGLIERQTLATPEVTPPPAVIAPPATPAPVQNITPTTPAAKKTHSQRPAKKVVASQEQEEEILTAQEWYDRGMKAAEEKNYTAAEHALLNAVEAGDTNARFELAKLHWHAHNNHTKARTLLEPLADAQDNCRAQVMMAVIYQELAEQASKNKNEANAYTEKRRHYWKRAAGHGHPVGILNTVEHALVAMDASGGSHTAEEYIALIDQLSSVITAETNSPKPDQAVLGRAYFIAAALSFKAGLPDKELLEQSLLHGEQEAASFLFTKAFYENRFTDAYALINQLPATTSPDTLSKQALLELTEFEGHRVNIQAADALVQKMCTQHAKNEEARTLAISLLHKITVLADDNQMDSYLKRAADLGCPLAAHTCAQLLRYDQTMANRLTKHMELLKERDTERARSTPAKNKPASALEKKYQDSLYELKTALMPLFSAYEKAVHLAQKYNVAEALYDANIEQAELYTALEEHTKALNCLEKGIAARHATSCYYASTLLLSQAEQPLIKTIQSAALMSKAFTILAQVEDQLPQARSRLRAYLVGKHYEKVKAAISPALYQALLQDLCLEACTLAQTADNGSPEQKEPQTTTAESAGTQEKAIALLTQAHKTFCFVTHCQPALLSPEHKKAWTNALIKLAAYHQNTPQEEHWLTQAASPTNTNSLYAQMHLARLWFQQISNTSAPKTLAQQQELVGKMQTAYECTANNPDTIDPRGYKIQSAYLLASAYQMTGNNAAAQLYYNKVISAYENAQPETKQAINEHSEFMGVTYSTLAHHARQNGNHARAYELYTRSLEHPCNVKDVSYYERACLSIAGTNGVTRNFAAAHEDLIKSAALGYAPAHIKRGMLTEMSLVTTTTMSPEDKLKTLGKAYACYSKATHATDQPTRSEAWLRIGAVLEKKAKITTENNQVVLPDAALCCYIKAAPLGFKESLCEKAYEKIRTTAPDLWHFYQRMPATKNHVERQQIWHDFGQALEEKFGHQHHLALSYYCKAMTLDMEGISVIPSHEESHKKIQASLKTAHGLYQRILVDYERLFRNQRDIDKILAALYEAFNLAAQEAEGPETAHTQSEILALIQEINALRFESMMKLFSSTEK